MEAELAKLEAELQEKQTVLAETRAREGALATRLAASERRAGRLGEALAQMEAGLREAEAEAAVPHRALRRGATAAGGGGGAISLGTLRSGAWPLAPASPRQASLVHMVAVPAHDVSEDAEAPESPQEVGKLLGTWTKAREDVAGGPSEGAPSPVEMETWTRARAAMGI